MPRNQPARKAALRQKPSFAFEAKGGEPHQGSSPLLRSSREQRKSSNALPKSTASPTEIFARQAAGRRRFASGVLVNLAGKTWAFRTAGFAGVFHNQRPTLVRSRHPQTIPFP